MLLCIATLPASCWIRYLAARQSAYQNSSSSTHPITASCWCAAQVRCGCWTSVPTRRRCRAATTLNPKPPPASPPPTETTAPHRNHAAAAADVGKLTTARGDWHGVASVQLFADPPAATGTVAVCSRGRERRQMHTSTWTAQAGFAHWRMKHWGKSRIECWIVCRAGLSHQTREVYHAGPCWVGRAAFAPSRSSIVCNSCSVHADRVARSSCGNLHSTTARYCGLQGCRPGRLFFFNGLAAHTLCQNK